MNNLKPHEAADPTISLAPLSSKPPAGKTVDFVGCPITACQEVEQGLQSAASAVGWTVKVFNGGLTPATITAAWNSIVQTPGNAVAGVAILPDAAIQTQLDALKAKNVPVAFVNSPSPVAAPVIVNFSSAPEFVLSGKLAADWIIADSDGKAKVGYFTDLAYSSLLSPIETAFTSEMHALCPGCSVDVQSVNYATGVGTTIPPAVVSFVQRNPSVHYIVFDVGDNTAGVAQALAAAGLASQVKIVTRDSDTPNVKAIAAGTEAMGVTSESYEVGWRLIDALIRHVEGMAISDPTPVDTLHVITKNNLPANVNVPYTVPNYQSYFRKAWLLSP
jgi:ribose transport system substrate-binding protein